MNALRIVLVDDHGLVRAGIRSLLESIEGVSVEAEGQDGHEALELVRAHSPDIVIMDIAMSGLNGLEATRSITKDYPNVRVIILSMFANEEYVAGALSAGAKGYLLKNATPGELQVALRSVAMGDTYLTAAVSKAAIEEYKSRLAERFTPLERLTPRQREILQLIAEGNTSKEIAAQLNLSIKTVDMHRTMLMKELNIHDIAGLVRYAIRTGLVTPEN